VARPERPRHEKDNPVPTRSHTHEEVFAATPERLFALLHTPSAIREWWGAARVIVFPEADGVWVAAWGDEDQPDYITAARIRVFDPPRRLVLDDYRYVAKSGPLPFEAEFVTEFTVELHPQGALLRAVQDGFPCESVADEFYAACERGWKETFAGIRKYLTAQWVPRPRPEEKGGQRSEPPLPTAKGPARGVKPIAPLNPDLPNTGPTKQRDDRENPPRARYFPQLERSGREKPPLMGDFGRVVTYCVMVFGSIVALWSADAIIRGRGNCVIFVFLLIGLMAVVGGGVKVLSTPKKSRYEEDW
jgi:uncharacterized protein YndB with AHSA1/START domain